MLPIEPELDQRIAGYESKTATFLQIAKETYARAGEIWALKWIDLNVNILTINQAEKGSNPRQFKISEKLVSMLNALPNRDQTIVGPQLGHRYMENMIVCTQLINFETDEWHVAHAKTLDEEDRLIQVGFEFVRYGQGENVAIHRKRK